MRNAEVGSRNGEVPASKVEGRGQFQILDFRLRTNWFGFRAEARRMAGSYAPAVCRIRPGLSEAGYKVPTQLLNFVRL